MQKTYIKIDKTDETEGTKYGNTNCPVCGASVFYNFTTFQAACHKCVFMITNAHTGENLSELEVFINN